jgi:hypothetical protein
MDKYETISIDDLTDKLIGKVGTPERDAFDARVMKEVNAHLALRKFRKLRLANQRKRSK